MRNGRLFHLQRLGEVTNRVRRLSEARKYAHPAPRRECLHGLRHLPSGVHIEKPHCRLPVHTMAHDKDHIHMYSYGSLWERSAFTRDSAERRCLLPANCERPRAADGRPGGRDRHRTISFVIVASQWPQLTPGTLYWKASIVIV